LITLQRPLNVLHVNNVDLYGRRFNGYDLLDDLRSRGVNGKQAVLDKRSDNPDVFSLWSGPADKQLHDALAKVEKRRSMNNLLFPWGQTLAASVEFKNADVVHYHLLHNQVIGLLDVPMLFASKPSVWTFHDPWPLTGHCIYPQDSTGWMTGCFACPRLQDQFPMDRDYAYRMFRVKQRVYADLDVDIVIASEFMREMVSRSPLTAHFKSVHLIPFGVDGNAYLADDQTRHSRAMLGIPPDDFVVLFRATEFGVKGLRYIIDALAMRLPTRPTTLLTVDQKGLVRSLEKDYRVVELGWVEDEILFPRVYSASDVLLMPSTAEAFGLMALEAMAAGRPVITFEGTSLPWVTGAPECGIAVPMANAAALRDAIDVLASNPDEGRRRGALGRAIARTRFRHDAYLDALTALYARVAEKGARDSR
jgi:glycosyltransferase involved in cell wall biosynthesis